MDSMNDGVWTWAAEQVFVAGAPKLGSLAASLACNGPKADCSARAAAEVAQEAVSDHVLGTVYFKPTATYLQPSTQAASAARVVARVLSRRGAKRAFKAAAAALATWAAARGLLLREPAARGLAAVPSAEAAPPLEAAGTPPSKLEGAPEAADWSEQLPTAGLWVLVVAVALAGVLRRRAAAVRELRRRPKVVSTATSGSSSGASSPRSSRSVMDTADSSIAGMMSTPVETPLLTPRSKGEDSLLFSPIRPDSISSSPGRHERVCSTFSNASSVSSVCEQFSLCSQDSDTPETGSEVDVEDPFQSFEARFGLQDSPDCQRFSIHSDSDSEGHAEAGDAEAGDVEAGEDEEEEDGEETDTDKGEGSPEGRQCEEA